MRWQFVMRHRPVAASSAVFPLNVTRSAILRVCRGRSRAARVAPEAGVPRLIFRLERTRLTQAETGASQAERTVAFGNRQRGPNGWCNIAALAIEQVRAVVARFARRTALVAEESWH